MQVRITGVSVENIQSGRTKYGKAVVQYTFRGEPRSQNIMSFANPEVFKTVSGWENNLPDGEVEVTLGKNDKGYNEWRAVSNAASGASNTSAPASTAGTTTRVSGSNYETKEERAARQVLIVKQSSLSSAVEALGPKKDPKEYIAVAQQFTDWVFDNDAPKSDDELGDIPY